MPSGGVLPGVTVTITNTDNGTERVIVTNADGLYRAVLLPLGPLPCGRRVARIQALRAGRHPARGRRGAGRQRYRSASARSARP